MTGEFHTVRGAHARPGAAPDRRRGALTPREPNRTPREPVAVSGKPHGARRIEHAIDAERRRRPVPIVLVLLLSLVGAAGLGLMGNVTGDSVIRGSWEFSRLGGPWLMAGFAGGAIGGWRRGGSGLLLGAFAGALIVGAGSLAYYGLSYWEGLNGARRAAKLGIGWGVAGVGVGGVLGLLGAAYATSIGRHRSKRGGRAAASWIHGAALGTLGGLLVGEAIALLWVWDGQSLRAMATLEGLGGIALVVAGTIGRSWRFAVAAAIAMAASAAVAPAATTLLRDALRSIGWAGA